MASIFDEMNSLPPMRVQKVFGLLSNVLVLELYSQPHKKLFLVFDPTASMRSFHLQKERPQGQKSVSPLILMLRKYAEGCPCWFLGDDFLMKVIIRSREEDLVLKFSFAPFAVELAREPVQTYAIPEQGQESALVLNMAHAERYNLLNAKDGLLRVFNERLKELAHLIKKKKSLAANLEKDLLKARETLQREGDVELIKANMQTIKKGANHAVLMDYSSTPPGLRRVEIDERVPLRTFVEQFYKKLKRAKRGINHIEPRKEQLALELAQLKQSLLALKEKGPSASDVGISSTKAPIIKNKKADKRIPYKSFTSSDGIPIWVGKSAKDNDALSLRYALGNEWWFHAQTAAGAHVVVKSPRDALPSATLVEAAMLAAHFSALKDEASPEVLYTRIKYVRKPKGLSPGKVLITQERSLFVRMDEAQLGLLLKQNSS